MKQLLKLLPAVSLIFLFSQAKSEDHAGEIIRYSVNCTLVKGKLTLENSTLLQINNKSGDKYARISIPFSKNNRPTIIEAWIEDTSGNQIRVLKKKDISESSAISDISLYEDHFVKKFELKHNIYPYRIWYRYKTEYKDFLDIADWYAMPDTDIPTHFAEFTADLPPDYPVKVYLTRIADNKPSEVNGRKIYHWEVHDLPALRNEYLSPSLVDLIPRVLMVPLEFHWYANGSFESWDSFGDWVWKLIKDKDDLPPDEMARVHNLLLKHPDRKEMVRNLYHYLQDNTRYIDVSINYGGLVPYPATYVAQNKYGDCKALSNYMIALLKHAGIPAYYTMIEADDNPREFLASFPSQQFNHIVVTVPDENDTIFLECTSNTGPFGYMGSMTQNRQGFTIDQEKSRLITIPALSIHDVEQFRKRIFNVQPDGTCNAELSFTFRGPDFELFDALKNNYTSTDQEAYIRDHFLNFPDFEIKNWKLTRPYRDSAMIYLSIGLKIDSYAIPYGNIRVIHPNTFNIPLMPAPENRKLPLQINYPVATSDTTMIELPASAKNCKYPDDVSLNTSFGNYSRTLTHSGNKILIIRHIILKSGKYPVVAYAAFYYFIRDIQKNENQIVTFINNQ